MSSSRTNLISGLFWEILMTHFCGRRSVFSWKFNLPPLILLFDLCENDAICVFRESGVKRASLEKSLPFWSFLAENCVTSKNVLCHQPERHFIFLQLNKCHFCKLIWQHADRSITQLLMCGISSFYLFVTHAISVGVTLRPQA